MEKTCPQCGSQLSDRTRFCPQCGFNLESQIPVGEPEEQNALVKSKWLMRGFLFLVLAAGLVAYVRDAFRSYHPVIEKQPAVVQSEGYSNEKISSTPIQAKIEGPFVVVSLKEVLNRRIVRFFDPEGVQNVPVIAYVTPGGKLVTAMSLSENCRSTDFYLQGENIHCASCPSYWNMTSMEAYACCQKYYPDPIPSTVLGDEVRIEAQTIRNWKSRS
jgi:hypothetical protein